MVFNIVEIVVTKNKEEDMQILAGLEDKIKEYFSNKNAKLEKVYTTYSESDRIPIFTPIIIFRDNSNSEYCIPKFQINLDNIITNLDNVFTINNKEEIFKRFPEEINYLDKLILELNNEKKLEEEIINSQEYLNEDIPFIINEKRRAESLRLNIINAHLMSLNMYNSKNENVEITLSNRDDEFFNKLN